MCGLGEWSHRCRTCQTAAMATAHNNPDDVTPEQLGDLQRIAFGRPDSPEQEVESRRAQEMLAGIPPAEQPVDQPSIPAPRTRPSPDDDSAVDDAQASDVEDAPSDGDEKAEDEIHYWAKTHTVLFLLATVALAAFAFLFATVVESWFGVYRGTPFDVFTPLARYFPVELYRTAPLWALVPGLIACTMAIVAIKRSRPGKQAVQIAVLVVSSIATWNAIALMARTYSLWTM